MKYFIATYGCQMNKFDSMVIEGILESVQYTKASNIHQADIVFINGCSVREHAMNRALGFINSLRGKINSNAKIYIVGCLAMSLKQIPKFTNGLISPTNYKFIPSILNKETFVDMRNFEDIGDYADIKIKPGVSMFVSIIKGCNNFCSYCIVPYLRGEEYSIPIESIIKSIENSKSDITKEIFLLGQNVNSYKYKNIDFPELLNIIARHFKNMRIRFLTSHPKDISERLIKTIADNDNICNAIHLPLQSGSNKLLKLMHRGYTIETYTNIVKIIRDTLKEVVLTTDIMVGFPHEDNDDFYMTMKTVEEIEFDDAFMYRFSKRQFTCASFMEEPSEELKLNRLKHLIKVQNSIKIRKIKQLIDKDVEILVERSSKKNINDSIGRDRGDRMIVIRGKFKPGVFVKAKITSIRGITPIAEIKEA